MWKAIKQEWQKLRRSRPGRRFQTRYARNQRARGRRRGVQKQRIGRVTLGTFALAIGIVLIFIPGPAILFLAVGGGLIAAESLYAARLLDWCELRLRALWTWTTWKWGGLTLGARAGVVCLAAGSVSVGMYFSYRFVTG